MAAPSANLYNYKGDSMETKEFDHIQCKKLSIVDDEGKDRILLSTDDNGGHILIADKHGKDSLISLRFNANAQGVMGIVMNGKVKLDLSIDDEGGYIDIYGQDDEEIKVSLKVDDDGGCVVIRDKEIKAVLGCDNKGGYLKATDKHNKKVRWPTIPDNTT
jgi:hypothetical protein